MAIVKFHAVKKTDNKNPIASVLNYICNPSKTDNELLISGINVIGDKTLARMSMDNTKYKFNKQDRIFKGNNKQVSCIHVIQSFDKKDNISPEQAHQIGLKLMKEQFPNHEIVCATHIDKGHIHNHFCINVIDIKTGERNYFKKKTVLQTKIKSNELCERFNFKIINLTKNREKAERSINLNYAEWAIRNNKDIDKKVTSIKFVTEKIDAILFDGKIKNIDELVGELNKDGIEVKYKNNQGNLYKHISFKVEGKDQKFFRGNYAHSMENILNRISDTEYDKKYNKFAESEWQKYAKDHYPKVSYKLFIKEAIDNLILEGKCKTVDDLFEQLKDRYNIETDYLTETKSVKKRIKFFAKDSKQKYWTGTYGIVGKDNSERYEYRYLRQRIEDSQRDLTANTIEIKSDINNDFSKVIKFTGDIKDDLKIVRDYFVYTKDVRVVNVNKYIDLISKFEIKNYKQLVSYQDLILNQIQIMKKEKNIVSQNINYINEFKKMTYELKDKNLNNVDVEILIKYKNLADKVAAVGGLENEEILINREDELNRKIERFRETYDDLTKAKNIYENREEVIKGLSKISEQEKSKILDDQVK